MKKLSILILIASSWLSAAVGDIIAARIVGSTTGVTDATSACSTASACTGWVLELDETTSSWTASGEAYSLGFSQANNNSTAAATIVLTLTSTGYKDCTGTTTTRTRVLYATHQLRERYNNASTNDHTLVSNTLTLRFALSDIVYSGDTSITASVGAASYTYSSTGNNAITGLAVTNSSTLAYSTARTIANWSRPGWQRVSGSTFRVGAVAFQRHGMSGLPVACVSFTATDAHAHTVTVNATAPTIDPSFTTDYGKVVEYVADFSTSTLTQADLLTVQFKAYPWVGDSGAVMDTSDGVNAQPTPLYAPQYYVLDKSNVFSAAAYVDGSETFPGSHTSGTFVAGEKLTQSTSTATAYLIDVTGANGAGPIHIGAVVTGTTNSTNGSTWTGATSGAVFTQTGAPTFAGSDSNSCAVAESSWNPGSPPSPCRTINGGAVKMAAYNNASSTPTHNDACGTAYLAQGYYNWMGASAAASNTTANCWLNITPISGTSKAQVVIDQQSGSQGFGTACTSGSTSCGTPIHVQGITINIATGPVSVFSAETYFWPDNVSFTCGGTAPVYQVTVVYWTGGQVPSTLAGNGIGPFGTTNTSIALLRGVDFTGVTNIVAHTILANINNTLGAYSIQGFISGETAPHQLQSIIAFNKFFKAQVPSQPILWNWMSLGPATILGGAVIQNIWEANTTTATLVNGIANDAGTQTPVNNIMQWYNVTTGGRINRSYNETGSTILLRQAWSELADLRDQEAIKSDTFPTANSARVGNWAELYAVGRRSMVNAELTGGSSGFAATGTFQMEFGGLNSYNPTVTAGSTQPPTSLTNAVPYFKYKNRASFDGTSAGTGGGDYRLLSNSPGINMVPAGTGTMPYDLDGQLRNNSGWGSAGAFEQAIVMTPVFAW